MRSSTGGEDTVLAATFRKTYVRVDIMDAAGVMQDMGSYTGYDWLCYVSIDEHLDQPCAAATIVLRRELDLVGGLGYTTLAPLRTDSPANPTGPTAYVYRSVKVYTAVVTGNRPAGGSSDWKLKFDGVSDSVDQPDDDTLVIECRDKGAYLIDQWLSPPPGLGKPELLDSQRRKSATLEWVCNTLLTAAPITVGTPETVYVPTDPNYIVTSLPLKYEPVMDTIQRAASLAACDFRFGWVDATSNYRPVLLFPDRDTPSSVFTLGDSDIIRWRNLKVDRLGIRNVIRVSYLPKSTNVRTFVQVSDATSIADFGTRMLVIIEPDDSSIDTATEAETLAELILADLKDPAITGEVELLHDWRLELNDYGTFEANKFFDIDQDLAIVGIRHELMENDQTTTLSVRGKPSAGYARWIQRAKMLPTDPTQLTALDNGLSNVQHTDNDVAGTRTYTWERGGNVAFVAFYQNLASVPVTGSPFPAAEDVLTTSGSSILSTTTDTWVATKPQRGKQRFGILVPYYKLGGRAMIGTAVKFIIDPLPSNLAVAMAEQNDAVADGNVDLGISLFGSSSDWPVTVEVWIGEETGAADYSYTASASTADIDAGPASLKNLAIPSDSARFWTVKATNVGGEIARATYTERIFKATKGAVIAPAVFNESSSYGYSFDANGFLQNGTIPINGSQRFVGQFELPPGVTITQVAIDWWLDAAYPGATFNVGSVSRIENQSGALLSSALGSNTTGWLTVSDTVSELTSDTRTYVVVVSIGEVVSNTTGIAAGLVKLGPIYVTYDMPDPSKAK